MFEIFDVRGFLCHGYCGGCYLSITERKLVTLMKEIKARENALQLLPLHIYQNSYRVDQLQRSL